MSLTPNFQPYSDIVISDEPIVTSHKNLIKQGNYEEAKNLLDENLDKKGFRASFFNLIENKIKELQIYLLNKTATPDEYYSFDEPDVEFMKENNYLFWIKPIE